MRNSHTGAIASVAGVLVLTALAAAQNNQSNAARSPWKYYPVDRAVGDGGPAPKRDLTGTWAGTVVRRQCSWGRGRAEAMPRIRRRPVHAVRPADVRPEQADRTIQPRRHQRSACPILRSVWFSAEHDRTKIVG